MAAMAGLHAARQALWAADQVLAAAILSMQEHGWATSPQRKWWDGGWRAVTPTQRRRAQRKRAKADMKVGTRQTWTPIDKNGDDTAAAPPCPSENRGASAMQFLPPTDKRGAEEDAAAEVRSVRQRPHERGRLQREVLRDDDVHIVHVTHPDRFADSRSSREASRRFFSRWPDKSQKTPASADSRGSTKSSLETKKQNQKTKRLPTVTAALQMHPAPPQENPVGEHQNSRMLAPPEGLDPC